MYSMWTVLPSLFDFISILLQPSHTFSLPSANDNVNVHVTGACNSSVLEISISWFNKTNFSSTFYFEKVYMYVAFHSFIRVVYCTMYVWVICEFIMFAYIHFAMCMYLYSTQRTGPSPKSVLASTSQMMHSRAVMVSVHMSTVLELMYVNHTVAVMSFFLFSFRKHYTCVFNCDGQSI